MTKNAKEIYNKIIQYKNKWQSFPTISYLAHSFGLQQKEIENYLFELSKYGLIFKKDNKYIIKENINPPGAVKKESNIEAEIKSFKKPELVKEIMRKKINKNSFNIIKNIFFKLLVVFPVIIGVYLSIFFTKLWFDDMFDWFPALCVSLFIVFSSLVSFQIFTMMKKKKNKIKYIFIFLWIIVITFSISTGVNGQLNLELNKKIKNQENETVDKSKILLYENYEKRINDLKIDIESVRKERDNLQISLTKIDYVDNKKQYLDVNWLISTKDKKIKKLKTELNDFENKKEQLLKQNIKLNVAEKTDFFEWLESIFKIKADIFRLVLYLFLAIFADVIPPMFFSIVLFYKE
jgi:hypothetical protein